MPDSRDREQVIITLPNFTEEQWNVVLEHWSGSSKKLSYVEQRSLQSTMVGKMKDEGARVQEVQMDPHKMLSWFQKKKLRNDSLGRSQYYAEAGRCHHLGLPEPE